MSAALPPRPPVERPVVVVPTYNERENLPALAEAVLKLPVAALRLLVVDDNSPDGTGALADNLAAAAGGRMAVLHRPGKGGLGPAYLAGFAWALANVALPRISLARDRSETTRIVELASASLLAFYLPIAIGAPFAADWIVVTLFGSQYEEAGATGIIVPLDSRLLDLLRNGDEEEDRSDLNLSQG